MAGEQFLGGDITGDGVNDVDITNAGDFTIINGVQFTDAVRIGSGTGGYNTFLAISNNSGVEAGFNSDDTPPIDATNKDIDQAKTHTVLLSSLVVKTIGGVDYYEIRVDLNEANSDPNAQISLDQFKVYTSTNGGIESTTSLFSTGTLKYDMDAGGNKSILLSDAGSTGSGTDDYSILIPTSLFAGQDPTTTYMYVYAQLGAAGTDWTATSTFEEFNLENGVALTGVKFNDINGNGVRDTGEDGVAGVTIYIDANKNGSYDVGERTTVTDANGNYTFFGVPLNQTVWIDEVTPAGATQTTGDHETVVIASNATGTITVDPIGNHYPVPSINIDKTAALHDNSDCADTVGELVDYTVTVTNNGELALEHVVVTDSLEGGAARTLTVTGDTNANGIVDGNEVWLSGDTGNDGILSVGEVWTLKYVHAVTQADIDSNGGDNDGTLDNVATVTSDPTGSSTTNVTDSDDATVDVCQNPALTIDKTAALHDDSDCADTVGELVDYTVVLTNSGNVSLENVVVTDSLEGGAARTLTVTGDTNANGIVDGNEVWLSGDTGNDGILSVGEEWTLKYVHAVTQSDIDSNGGDNDGTLDNIATANADAVTSGEAAPTVSDDASVDVCQNPALTIDKTAALHDDSDCADTVGELVDYTVVLTNSGNVSLENVVVTDSLEGGAARTLTVTGDTNANGIVDGDEVWLSGDTGNDGILSVGEEWTLKYVHAVTQADIDSNGGDGDGTLDNIATANADAVTSGEAAPTVSDDASVDVCQNPALTIDKTAALHDGSDCADTVGELVDYTVVLTNSGNVSLENVVVTDSLEGGAARTLTVTGDTNANGIVDGDEVWLSGDTGNDGILSVGEEWTLKYVHAVTQSDIDTNGGDDDGTLDNIATANADAVTSGEAAPTVSDDASVDVCQNPTLSIDKTAALHDDSDCADTVGELVDYTVVLTNSGNVALENVVVTDSLEGGAARTLTVTGDTNANGIVDGDEVWLSGDTGNDGILSVGEEWTLKYVHAVTQADIDSNGGDNDGTLDNIATANADAVVSGEAVPTVSDDASVDVCQNPALTIDKTAALHDDSDCADTVGELVDYTVTVTNSGNVSIENVVVTDSLEGGAARTLTVTGDTNANGIVDGDEVWLSGDTGNDGILSVGEEWTLKYVHAVTQADIDSNGGDGDGTLDNIATANGDAVTSGEAAPTVSDDASVDVCQFPTIDITKYVDVGAGWDDANSAPGPQDLAIGDPVDFKVTLTNTGNVTLTDVDLTDQNNSNGTTGTPHLLIDNGVLTQYAIDHGAILTEDDTTDGVLQVGETWTITYTEAFDSGQHENTAAATTAEGASDEDDANYFSVVNLGPCPRTPGFWQNMKNGGAFWDGISGNEKHAGEHDFPTGELLYAVDSNNDGTAGGAGDVAGLLIGDWNKNGVTDAGEDTLFISYADARSLINASNKQLANGGGDGKFMLGRDMVAAWLNYEMGAGFGDASDPASPTSYLQDAINFMQIYSGATGGTGVLDETFDKFVLSGAIKASTSLWKTVQPGVDHSGAQLHGALDYYNNTGMTSPDGIVYAQCDEDTVTATTTMAGLTGGVKAAPLSAPSSLQHPMMGMVGFHDFTTHLGTIAQHTPDIV